MIRESSTSSRFAPFGRSYLGSRRKKKREKFLPMIKNSLPRSSHSRRNKSRNKETNLPKIHSRNVNFFTPQLKSEKRSSRILKGLTCATPPRKNSTISSSSGIFSGKKRNFAYTVFPTFKEEKKYAFISKLQKSQNSNPVHIKRYSTINLKNKQFPPILQNQKKKVLETKREDEEPTNRKATSSFSSCDLLEPFNDFKSRKLFQERTRLISEVESFLAGFDQVFSKKSKHPYIQRQEHNESVERIQKYEHYIKSLSLLKNEYVVMKGSNKKNILRKLKKVRRYNSLVKKQLTSLLRKKCESYRCSFQSKNLPLDAAGDDCVMLIFTFLPRKDLVYMGFVCRRFYFYATSNRVWRERIKPNHYQNGLMKLFERQGKRNQLFWKIWYCRLKNCRGVLGKNINGLWSICDGDFSGAIDILDLQIGLHQVGFDLNKREINALLDPYFEVGSRKKRFLTIDILRKAITQESSNVKIIVLKNV